MFRGFPDTIESAPKTITGTISGAAIKANIVRINVVTILPGGAAAGRATSGSVAAEFENVVAARCCADVAEIVKVV